jgi:hypothetical protein
MEIRLAFCETVSLEEFLGLGVFKFIVYEMLNDDIRSRIAVLFRYDGDYNHTAVAASYAADPQNRMIGGGEVIPNFSSYAYGVNGDPVDGLVDEITSAIAGLSLQ